MADPAQSIRPAGGRQVSRESAATAPPCSNLKSACNDRALFFRLGLLLICGTFLAYLPIWHAGFIWDDNILLRDNPLIKQPDGWLRIWFTKVTDYVPATSLSWWLEWRLWGDNPLGYHLDNVLLHGVNSILLWRVLRKLRVPGCWLAAAIFAVHPVAVESVAWISERKNTLAMLWVLVCLLFYLRFEETLDAGGQVRDGQGATSNWWRWLALAAFALALLSKTAVAPLPVVLLGIAWWRRGRIDRKDWARSVPFFSAALAAAVVAIWIQHQAGSVGVRADSLGSRLAGAGCAAWFYLSKAIWPFGLVPIYPRWRMDGNNLLFFLPDAALAAVFCAGWIFRRNDWGKAMLLGMGYFVVMLLPALGFVNISFMRYSLVADHWQYFALPGPIALAAAAIARGWQFLDVDKRIAPARPLFWALLLIGLGALTVRQCRVYCDSETLWTTTLRSNPNCWLAYYNLGCSRLAQGRRDEAFAYFRKTVELEPDFAEGQNNWGKALFQEGRVDEALAHLERAVQLRPGFAEAHYNLGAVLLAKGRAGEALDHFQREVDLTPEDAVAQENLANVLVDQGLGTDALPYYAKALQIRPDFAEAHYKMANILQQQGFVPQAVAHYRAALQIQPGNLKACNNLAWTLATSAQASVRNGAEAVQLARQAETISNGTNAIVLGTLAAAFAEAGKFPDAAATAQRARTLALTQSNAVLADGLEKQLRLYQTGKPLRDGR
jgi:protein O-mannosyl-transferase